LSKFVIRGNVEQVCAGLKATFDAQDAKFKADLDAIFKPVPATNAPPRAPAASTSPAANRWPLGTNRGGRFAR